MKLKPEAPVFCPTAKETHPSATLREPISIEESNMTGGAQRTEAARIEPRTEGPVSGSRPRTSGGAAVDFDVCPRETQPAEQSRMPEPVLHRNMREEAAERRLTTLRTKEARYRRQAEYDLEKGTWDYESERLAANIHTQQNSYEEARRPRLTHSVRPSVTRPSLRQSSDSSPSVALDMVDASPEAAAQNQARPAANRPSTGQPPSYRREQLRNPLESGSQWSDEVLQLAEPSLGSRNHRAQQLFPAPVSGQKQSRDNLNYSPHDEGWGSKCTTIAGAIFCSQNASQRQLAQQPAVSSSLLPQGLLSVNQTQTGTYFEAICKSATLLTERAVRLIPRVQNRVETWCEESELNLCRLHAQSAGLEERENPSAFATCPHNSLAMTVWSPRPCSHYTQEARPSPNAAEISRNQIADTREEGAPKTDVAENGYISPVQSKLQPEFEESSAFSTAKLGRPPSGLPGHGEPQAPLASWPRDRSLAGKASDMPWCNVATPGAPESDPRSHCHGFQSAMPQTAKDSFARPDKGLRQTQWRYHGEPNQPLSSRRQGKGLGSSSMRPSLLSQPVILTSPPDDPFPPLNTEHSGPRRHMAGFDAFDAKSAYSNDIWDGFGGEANFRRQADREWAPPIPRVEQTSCQAISTQLQSGHAGANVHCSRKPADPAIQLPPAFCEQQPSALPPAACFQAGKIETTFQPGWAAHSGGQRKGLEWHASPGNANDHSQMTSLPNSAIPRTPSGQALQKSLPPHTSWQQHTSSPSRMQPSKEQPCSGMSIPGSCSSRLCEMDAVNCHSAQCRPRSRAVCAAQQPDRYNSWDQPTLARKEDWVVCAYQTPPTAAVGSPGWPRGWAALPSALLHEVAKRLPNQADLGAMRATCKAWWGDVSDSVDKLVLYKSALPKGGFDALTRTFYLLRSLDIYKCNTINEVEFMAAISHLSHLVSLRVVKCTRLSYNTACWLPQLQGLSLLRDLSVGLQDKGMPALGFLTQLTRLNLQHSNWFKRWHSFPLGALTGLRALIIPNIKSLGDQDLGQALSGLAKLTHLNLRGCWRLSVAVMNAISGLRSLSMLNMSTFRNMTFSGLSLLQRCSGVTMLHLGYCGVVNDTSAPILGAMTQLKVLNLTGCINLGDAGLATLARSLTSLRSLNLMRCWRLGDDGVQSLLSLQHLVAFSLIECPHVSSHVVGLLAWNVQLILADFEVPAGSDDPSRICGADVNQVTELLKGPLNAWE